MLKTTTTLRVPVSRVNECLWLPPLERSSCDVEGERRKGKEYMRRQKSCLKKQTFGLLCVGHLDAVLCRVLYFMFNCFSALSLGWPHYKLYN